MRLVLSLFLLLGLSQAATLCGNVDCFHGAQCAAGDADFSNHVLPDGSVLDVHDTVSSLGVHCDCPPEYTGLDCSVAVENCDDGVHRCYHGGECSVEPGALPYCSCDLANDVDGNKYVGKYCESVANNYCDHVDIKTFCLNGGTCNPGFPTNNDLPCTCSGDFKGAHCEYKGDAVKDCTLDCQNGGLCRLGEDKDAPRENQYLNPNKGDYQHCECPAGFLGELCETTSDACGGINCLNGSVCKTRTDPATNRDEPYCDCESISTSAGFNFFAGQYCQYESNAICAQADDVTYFCVNDGSCQQAFKDGCVCPPGQEGFHCEFTQEQDCTLPCENQGQCTLGDPPSDSPSYSYWLVDDNHHDFQFCNCTDDFTGRVCEITAGDVCGDFACFNEGVCDSDVEDGETVLTCNCLQAYENGVYYDGRYCQFGSTSICFEDISNNESYFCMNNGHCQADHLQGCVCPEGFGGFSCEYVEDRDCTLDCNAGECMLGSPPGQDYLTAYWYDAEDYRDYQYCSCPDGTSGEFCEAITDDCGSFLCLNGGSCTNENGQFMETRCNCIPAFNDDTYFDGLYCQFASTNICFEGDDESFFCMNNGQCQPDFLKGCVCPEGYGGFSCELVQDQDCTLDCQNGSQCVLGEPPEDSHVHAYWMDAADQERYQYCDCVGDFGGKFCEAASVDCGAFTCLNGGKCTDQDGGLMADRCNCLEADDVGVYYDGLYCQFASTSICFEDDTESYFCMNDGRCQSDHTQGCICAGVYTGFSCELVRGEDCDLNCQNSGVCTLGEPPEDSHLHAYWKDADLQENYQYCKCQGEFSGQFCESQFEDCGDFTCLNGGQCNSVDGTAMDGRCNCIEAFDDFTDTYFEGKFCQYPSTSVCYEDDVESYFCANGGTCQDDFSFGCSCLPGFGGFSCEFNQNVDCDLDCENGGTCNLGSRPDAPLEEKYWFNPDKQGEYQYCDCPNGFTGTTCETFSNRCGENLCFNGGTCVTADVEGEEVHHCDCRDEDEDGTYYAGRFCQYESTEVCEEEENTVYFCVNEGRCQHDYHSGCICNDGNRGFSCEFVISPQADSEEDAECKLDCHGNGVCRNGIKDISDLGTATNAGHLSYTHDDFQHCVCEDGFTGLTCEHKIEQCQNSDQFCLHGSECVRRGGDTTCDCSKADSDIAENFAGDYCEHTADVCVQGDSESPQSYCANGGTCKAYFDEAGAPHPGCECPTGITGDRCEINLDKSDNKAAPSTVGDGDGDGGVKGLGIAAIILSVCAICAVSMFALRGCFRRRTFSKRSGVVEKSRLMWSDKSFKDNVESINFSPHRNSSYVDDGYMASFASPSRDPMATAFAPEPDQSSYSDASTGKPDIDDEPQIFIGPPRDEDGHVLHSVDII